MQVTSYKKNLSIKCLHGPFFCNVSNLDFNFDPSVMVRGNRRHPCPCFHTKCHSNVLKFRFFQKKENAEICVKIMPKLKGWYRESRKVQIWCSQTCIRPPLLGPLKSGHLRQVVVLQKTFLNFPLTKCGCCWQVFSLFHGTIFVNKELQQRLFWCYSGRIKF